MRVAIAVGLAACSGGHAPTTRARPIANTTSEPALAVELVVASHEDADGDKPRSLVRFAKATAAGVVVTRSVAVPGSITSLAWVGPDPVVMFDDGAVGRVTATGFAPLPKVPETKWVIPKPTTGSVYEPTERFDTPRWRMLTNATGAVWQARCDWGWDLPHGIAHHCVPEGGNCHAWVYAQVWPGATTVSMTAPAGAFDSDERPARDPIPTAQPPASIRAEIVPVSVPDGPESRPVLECTQGDATIQYPTDDDRDLRDNGGDGVGGLTWLSTTPPLFAVTRRVGCLDTESVIFEGCKISEAYLGAEVFGGPQDLLVLWKPQDTLQLRRHDRDVGTLERVLLYAFKPR